MSEDVTLAEKLIFHDREHERLDGMYYISVRAISSIVNLNYDGWPSDELQESYKTFIGKPVFVDHHSDDDERARGIILDSQFVRSDDDAWIELLLEIDAQAFPMLAHELRTGGLDSVSMGAYVETIECSICGELTLENEDHCMHIPHMKGQMVGGELVYEICRDITFYEISLVFDPADVTAIAKNVVAGRNTVQPTVKSAVIGTSGYPGSPTSYHIDVAEYGQDAYHEVIDAFPFSHSNEGDDKYADIFSYNPYARIRVDDLADMEGEDEADEELY